MQKQKFDYGEEYQQKLQEIMDKLKEEYGDPEPASRPDPVDSLIKTILSQNTNDINRDKAKKKLDKTFDSYQEILDADVEEVTEAVRIAGLGPTKAERIQTFLRILKEERGEFSLDHVPEMEKEEAKNYLQEFPGVGPKTAAVTLCFAFDMPVMPVDTHVHRLARRFELIPDNMNRSKAHYILEREVPDERIYEFHINLINHGREVCKARNPKCQESFMSEYCVNCVCRE
mgnify:CR=1 FL=1